MKTTGLNGSPKHLMVWLPGFYWTNMLLTSATYIFMSYRVFKITVVLRDAAISKEPSAVYRTLLVGAGTIALFYALGAGLLASTK